MEMVSLIGYLLFLFIAQIFVFGVILVVDYYGKERDWKKLKLNALGKILVKSKHHNKNEIVNISLYLQIINLIYVMIYVINSIIDSFFYPNKLFYYFNIVSLILVGICSFVAIMVIDVRFSK